MFSRNKSGVAGAIGLGRRPHGLPGLDVTMRARVRMWPVAAALGLAIGHI